MSKFNFNKKNETGTTENKKLDKTVLIWLSLIFLAGAITIIVTIINDSKKNNTVTNNTVGYVEGQDYSDSTITTYLYEHEVLHGDSITKAVGDMQSIVDYLRSQNAYIRVQVGESDFDYYIYNKQGECLAQTSDGSTCVVFRKDGNQSISFGGTTGNVMLGNDADIISIIENVLTIANSDTTDREGITVFHMTKSDESETPDSFQEYRVEIVGEDNFREIYNSINEELADNILETLKGQISQVSESEFIPHLIYTIICDTEDKSLTIACEIVVDGIEHSNWVLDGYLTLDDWQLTDDWYSDDFSTLTSDESFNKLDLLLSNIQELINKFAEDNNISTEEEVTNDEEQTNTENSTDSEETEVESEENSDTSTDNESDIDNQDDSPSDE